MSIARRKVPLVMIIAALFTAGISAALPAAAEACGMRYRQMLRPADADRYLVEALRHFEKGEVDLALFQARRVLKVPQISGRQRAQALTVSSWAAWKRGEHPGAVATLREARAADVSGEAVEAVLDRAADRELTAALRRAAVG